MRDGANLLRVLHNKPWRAIKAHSRPSIYFWGVLFEVDTFELGISGEDHMMSDHTDTFSLKIFDHHEKEFWPELRSQAPPDSKVRDLRREWAHRPVSALFNPPRNVRFFTNKDFEDVISTREAILMRCVALEFRSPSDSQAKLMITAEQMNISIFIDNECEEHIQPYFVEYDPSSY